MGPLDSLRLLLKRLTGRHGGLKSFSHESSAAGGVVSGVDRGLKTVSTTKVIGSVSRWQNLRSDFFYRTGQAMTRRFYRVGEAMAEGKPLPPVELYKLTRRETTGGDPPQSEYYVVDGHHRVAMARKLGQDFLDAHVTEFATAGQQPDETHRAETTTSSASPSREDLSNPPPGNGSQAGE